MALTEIHLTALLFRSSFRLPVRPIKKKKETHSQSPKEGWSAIMMTVTQSNKSLSERIQASTCTAVYHFRLRALLPGMFTIKF